MQDSLQNQIGIMENSISRITDVAVAHEDSRWGVPAKAAAKAKPTQMRGKAKVSGSDDGMDAEEEDAEAAPVLDDAEEKRNEEVSPLGRDHSLKAVDSIMVDGNIIGEQSEAAL